MKFNAQACDFNFKYVQKSKNEGLITGYLMPFYDLDQRA